MLDHGLETEEERSKEGKSREGKIKIEIVPLEKSFKIIFKDDGRGINLSNLRLKILKQGLSDETTVYKMKPKELYEFLFLPQFSTKENVNKLSGRGVGLDIIKNEVDSLSGSIEVISTEGKGTQFIIELPILK